MTGVQIRVDGSDRARGFLTGLSGRLHNPRGMFDAIGAALVVSTQQRFEQQRAPAGNPWPPSIRALAEGGKTLIQSGRLVQSVTHEASNDGVAVGSNVLYAAVHQFGATIVPVTAPALAFKIGGKQVFAQSVTIPPRPYLGLDAEDEAEIEAIAGDWLLQEEAEGNSDAG